MAIVGLRAAVMRQIPSLRNIIESPNKGVLITRGRAERIVSSDMSSGRSRSSAGGGRCLEARPERAATVAAAEQIAPQLETELGRGHPPTSRSEDLNDGRERPEAVNAERPPPGDPGAAFAYGSECGDDGLDRP